MKPINPAKTNSQFAQVALAMTSFDQNDDPSHNAFWPSQYTETTRYRIRLGVGVKEGGDSEIERGGS